MAQRSEANATICHSPADTATLAARSAISGSSDIRAASRYSAAAPEKSPSAPNTSAEKTWFITSGSVGSSSLTGVSTATAFRFEESVSGTDSEGNSCTDEHAVVNNMTKMNTPDTLFMKQ